MTVRSLYTPEDLKRVRRELFDKKEGVDPILDEKIEYSDSVLDHCHVSQNSRAALHRQSNAFEGLVFNAYKRCLQWLTNKPLPDILRNLADYLEQDYSENPYHSGWIKKVKTRFNKLNADDQRNFLKKFGYEAGSNAKHRTNAFGVLVKDRELGYSKINSALLDFEQGNT